jgi:uncharacterized membrane protein
MQRRAATIGLGAVLAGLAATLFLGLTQKAPCAGATWGDLRQYRLLCYSDIVPLYATEQLQGDRLPFVNECAESPGGNCDEYPVLTMFTMAVAAVPADTYAGFFYANAFLLSLAALAIAIALYRLAGRRALYFALAPSLLIYAFVNWDLVAVALATGATLAFVRKRDAAAGILLGLGTAAKLYPALFLIPFAVERLRTKEPEAASKLIGWAGGTWLAVNLPFMLIAPHGWSEFFRFNAHRPVDWDSLWFIGCDQITGHSNCVGTGLVNILSLVLFVGASALVWRWKVARHPDTPRWHLGFPILVAFLLTNKVYSPQYGLWLLPWFALVLPELRWFIAFEIADMAVFVTRFAFFGHLSGGPNGWTDGFTIGFFQVAVLVRAAILVACVIRFVLRPPPGPREPVSVEQAVAA